MQKYLLVIGLLIGCSLAALAQQTGMPVKKSKADSIQAHKDSLKSKPFVPAMPREKVYHPDSNHSPHKAVIRSLILPGLGQIYNHNFAYLKVPAIYIIEGFIVWAYIVDSRGYKQNLAIAKFRQRGQTPDKSDPNYQLYQDYATANYSDQAINDEVRGFARYRDLSALGFVAVWGVQAIEAYVTAKFMHSYSMDSNFALKVEPTMLDQRMYAQNFNTSFYPGIKLTFTLK